MAEEAEFRVEIKDFRATDLTSRNRFRDKLRIVGEFDDQKFKTKKELIGGGGDITWKFSWDTEYKIFSWKALEEKTLRINLLRSKTEHYGHLSVDLHTLATGPSEHNLPILDFDNKVVGRLNFVVLLDQVTNIAVIFKQISVKNLEPASGHSDCNPYLKYAYSRHWPDVVEGNMKANYSDTQYNTRDPQWTDLPEIRFEASLRELLQESIVMHITHNGKLHNTTLARCNLLFRTLVDNGKTFKDEDLISFRGPLKVGTAEIEGLLTFKFLPRFAQMKPINVTRKAVHTEKGIYDATTLLPGLPLPKVPIIKTDERPVDTQRIGSESPSTQRKRLNKESSNSAATTSNSNLRKNLASKLEKESQGNDNGSNNNSPKSKSKPKEAPKPAATVDDLISFNTPPTIRRQRSLSHGGEVLAKPSFGNEVSNPFLDSSSAYIGTQNTAPLYVGSAQPSGVMFPAQPFSNPAMSLQPAAQFGFYAQPQPMFNPNIQPQPVFNQQPQPTFNPFSNPQGPTFNPFSAAPQGQPQPVFNQQPQPTFNPFVQK